MFTSFYKYDTKVFFDRWYKPRAKSINRINRETSVQIM